jgi:hypothetical protein
MPLDGHYNTSQQIRDAKTNQAQKPAEGFLNISTQKPDAFPTTSLKYRVCCECGGAVDMRNKTQCRNYSEEKGACKYDLEKCKTYQGSS